jgi:hypothetical protein
LSKRAQLLLELAEDLVLQKCRIGESWSHGGFHPDFKGKPRRSGNVYRITRNPYGQLLGEGCMKL